MADTVIDVINRTSRIRDARWQQLIPALQAGISLDFAPAWGADCDATLRFVGRGDAPDPTHWKLWLLNTSDDLGALGYHEDDTGMPEGKVFVLDDLRYGAEISVTASHELYEMLADPLTTRTATIGGAVYAVEASDPVEADSLGYLRDGFRLSDFVLPSYFGLEMSTKFDFMGYLAGPCPMLTPGGYQLSYVNGNWTTIAARHADGTMSHRAWRPLGRSERRARLLS